MKNVYAPFNDPRIVAQTARDLLREQVCQLQEGRDHLKAKLERVRSALEAPL